MSVGGMTESGRIEALEARLREKEQDIILAAQVGQSLLLEVDRLKDRLAKYERDGGTPRQTPKIKTRKSPWNAPMGEGVEDTSPPLRVTSSTSISTPKPLRGPRGTPKPSAVRQGLSLRTGNCSTPCPRQRVDCETKELTSKRTVTQSSSSDSLVGDDDLNPLDLDSALLHQTRIISWKLAESEKLNQKLKENLVAVKAQARESKKQAVTKEAQLQETAWNLEVSHQTLQEQVSLLELSLSKSFATVKELEKSNRSLEATVEALKQKEMHLISLNESLTIRQDAERLKFKKDLEEMAKKSSFTDVLPLSELNDRLSSAPKVTPASVDPPSLPQSSQSKKTRLVSLSSAFDASLVAALEESQRRLELLNESTRNHEREKSEILRDLQNCQARIKELDEKNFKPQQGPSCLISKSQQTSTAVSVSQLTNEAQIILLQPVGSGSEYIIYESKGLQAPSVMSGNIPSSWELMIRKREAQVTIHASTEFDLDSVLSQTQSEKSADEFQRSRAASQSADTDLFHNGGGQSRIESLTYTMIGTWFLKYNRHNKNPKLRYFWINPYTRTLHWSDSSPSQGRSRNASRSAPINSLTWNDDGIDGQRRNFPPTEIDVLVLASSHRYLRLLPLNWIDRSFWISGLTLLLQRSMRTSLPKQLASLERDVMSDRQSVVSGEGSHRSCSPQKGVPPSLIQSRPSVGHRRSMTIVAHDD